MILSVYVAVLLEKVGLHDFLHMPVQWKLSGELCGSQKD